MKYLTIETPGVQQHPEGLKTSLNARDDASLDSTNQQVKFSPQDCPKFDACRAPICPLDPDSVDRIHLKGEPVCYYLRLHAKNRLSAPEQGYVPANLALQVTVAYPKLIARCGPLKKALERAASSSVKSFHPTGDGDG